MKSDNRLNYGKCKWLTAVMLAAVLCTHTFAQTGNTQLLAQSADGKVVKLFWVIPRWDKGITGFDIKRKEGLGEWVKLNSSPIIPGILAKKNLSAADADKNEIAVVKAKLLKLLAAHKLSETEPVVLLDQLNDGDSMLHVLYSLFARDYDVALMAGFAFVDHSVSQKSDYEYGLFIQGTDEMLATASWNYGEIPDLNVLEEITSRSKPKANGILVMWRADTAKMKSASATGFNIYRQGIRLNNMPIQPIDSDRAEFRWYDKSASAGAATQYGVTAESLLGIEGMIKPYTYKPSEHTAEYKKTLVTNINSLGYYFKDGISVKWTFPKEHEHFLKGFYVEKNILPEGFKQVSPLLNPGVREFVDKTSSPVSGYMGFRVMAVYNDLTTSTGEARIYTYFPLREPPPPQNVRVNMVNGNKKATAFLDWDRPMPGDTGAESYRIYLSEPGSDTLSLLGEQPAELNTFTYIFQHGSASVYKFCITAVGNNKAESAMSDTVSVLTPSLELPPPVVSGISMDDNRVTLHWQFPEIADLSGFRIYQNDVVIAGEQELDKNVKQFTTSALDAGTTYNFRVTAVAKNGVTSDPSDTKSVTIPAVAGKK